MLHYLQWLQEGEKMTEKIPEIIHLKTASGESMQAAVALLNESEVYFTKIENDTIGSDALKKTPLLWAEDELERDGVILAFIGNVPVGCVRLANWNTTSPVVLLCNLYVIPSFRRMGVGSALVSDAIINVKRIGRHLELGVMSENVPALKFWKKYRMKKIYSWYWMF